MFPQVRFGKLSKQVIVRAYGDEPVRLVAGRKFGRYLVVSNAVTGTAIGFPIAHVYRDDEELYAALQRAYSAGDRKELQRLWGTLERFQA